VTLLWSPVDEPRNGDGARDEDEEVAGGAEEDELERGPAPGWRLDAPQARLP
jgi:hypothetical protein